MSLWLRFALAFWAALIVFGLTTSLVERWIQAQPRLDEQTQQQLNTQLERLSGAVSEGRRVEARMLIRRFPNLYVIDDEGRFVGRQPRRPLPESVISVDAAALAAGRFVAKTVTGPSGLRWRVVARAPSRISAISRPEGIVWRLLIASVASMLIAGLLAWGLIRPIRRLQSQAGALAAGDLAARVDLAGANHEMTSLGRQFNAMAESLERNQQQREELFRNLSHELRSPLARLRVASALARQSDNTAAALDRIDLEADRMDELIGKLLSITRFDYATATLDRSSVDVSELLHTIVDDALIEAEQKGTTLAAQIAPELNYRADAHLLGRAIENVVRNAITHTPAGSHITIEAYPCGEGIKITVTDNGPGLTAEQCQRVLTPFDNLGEGGGFGLGLPLANKVIEHHGGTLALRPNDAESGLRVTITLP